MPKKALTLFPFFLIFAFVLFIFSERALWSDTNEEESRLVYISKNPNVLMEKRKTAVSELIRQYPGKAEAVLFEILENPEESRLFQIYVADAIAGAKEPRFLTELSQRRS